MIYASKCKNVKPSVGSLMNQFDNSKYQQLFLVFAASITLSYYMITDLADSFCRGSTER
jgi:hypothetical protein